MLADFFTKPLQGSLFQTFRDLIMNVNPSQEPSLDYRSVLESEEAAGQTDNGWTIVQARSTTRNTKKSKPVMGASNADGRQQIKMVPAATKKHVSASMTHADSIKGKGAGNVVIPTAGNRKCSFQHRDCNDCRFENEYVRPDP
jgi:hypothetical protein